MRANDAPTNSALLLTPAEASKALAISPRKLWGMTASGEIPHIRLGRCVRYPVNDLREMIERMKKGGADQ
jgi:excisionase family DNA binding protein